MNAEAVTLAAAASDQDPAIGLRAVAALRKLVDQLERAQVRSARTEGWSWAEIAKELGVTRQAAYKKHARPVTTGQGLGQPSRAGPGCTPPAA